MAVPEIDTSGKDQVGELQQALAPLPAISRCGHRGPETVLFPKLPQIIPKSVGALRLEMHFHSERTSVPSLVGKQP